jgi:hypothetical protein
MPFHRVVQKLQHMHKDKRYGCRHSVLAILAVLVVVGCSMLIATFVVEQIMQHPSIGISVNNQIGHRRLGRRGRGRGRGRNRGSNRVDQFSDPKTVETRTVNPLPIAIGDAAKAQGDHGRWDNFGDPSATTDDDNASNVNQRRRTNCQIIYIMGVEGATHHGITPIIEALAKRQFDPETGRQYHVDASSGALEAGLFGWNSKLLGKWGFTVTPEIDHPLLVQRVVEEICLDDGYKHVMIMWASFPSGQEDDWRSYRIHRQKDWQSMSPDEILNNDNALQHPMNVAAFVQAYSSYVDIKFVVIHRPFLETIASHHEWDGGAVTHSNVIHGFLLIIRRFLDANPIDKVTGGRLWTLLCIERIMAKNYEDEGDVDVARQNMLSHVADFLGWPVRECNDCFKKWHESTKDPYKKLGNNVDAVLQHAKQLEDVWPPPGDEGVGEQQCRI